MVGPDPDIQTWSRMPSSSQSFVCAALMGEQSCLDCERCEGRLTQTSSESEHHCNWPFPYQSEEPIYLPKAA